VDQKSERKRGRPAEVDEDGDTKEEKGGGGSAHDATPMHEHVLDWYGGIEGYECDDCGKKCDEMWMCKAKVKPQCEFGLCEPCEEKRKQRNPSEAKRAASLWTRELSRVQPLEFVEPAQHVDDHIATTPLGLFNRFVPDEVIDRMVDWTEEYAARPSRKSKVHSPHYYSQT
jgi:hypothetical protein